MTNDEPKKSPEDDVREWLNRSGFPLEMRTVKKIREFRPMAVGQSIYYRDPITDTLREMDVKAVWAKFTDVHMFVHLTVECKSTTAPWILFRGEEGPLDEGNRRVLLLQSTLSDHPIQSDSTGMVRYVGNPLPALMANHWQGCYAIKQKASSEKNAKDHAFEATRQVVSSMYALHGQADSANKFLVSSYAFALVVTTSPLFVAQLDENNEIKVTATDREIVRIPLPHGGKTVHVHIVNESALHDFMVDFQELTTGLLTQENLKPI